MKILSCNIFVILQVCLYLPYSSISPTPISRAGQPHSFLSLVYVPYLPARHPYLTFKSISSNLHPLNLGRSVTLKCSQMQSSISFSPFLWISFIYETYYLHPYPIRPPPSMVLTSSISYTSMYVSHIIPSTVPVHRAFSLSFRCPPSVSSHLLAHHSAGRFDTERARFYSAEIVCALKFLHQKGIVYRQAELLRHLVFNITFFSFAGT